MNAVWFFVYFSAELFLVRYAISVPTARAFSKTRLNMVVWLKVTIWFLRVEMKIYIKNYDIDDNNNDENDDNTLHKHLL